MPRKRRNKPVKRSAAGGGTFKPDLLIALAAVLCAALLAVPFLFTQVWALSWPGVVLLIALLDPLSPRRALFFGWLFGLSWNLSTQYWISGTLERYAGFSPPLALFLFVLLCGLAGFQFGVFGWLCSKLRGRDPGGVLIYPLLWVAIEFLWVNLFPWRLGHSQASWRSFAQLAEITGISGISFMVMWLCTLAYRCFTASPLAGRWQCRLNPQHRRTLVVQVVVSVVLMAVILAWGHWRLRFLAGYLQTQPALKVALIQPGGEPGPRARWRECRQRSYAVQDEVDLVCWPESAVGTLYPLDLPSFEPQPGQGDAAVPCPDLKCHLLFGGTSFIEKHANGVHHFYNSVFATGPDQRVTGRYHKRILIPFGEYIPGEHRFPALHRLSPFKTAMFHPGATADPVILPGCAKVGVLICYEDLLSGLARDSVNKGAEILTNHTNDAWFGESTARAQHQHLARFRAIEFKRYLLRSTINGATSVIDPSGRIVTQAPLTHPATVVGTVHKLNIMTLYARWGDVFAWSCVLITALLAVRAWRGRQRPRSPA